MSFLKNKYGFTLIELLITVAIIGILAAISVSAYIGLQEKARKSNLEKAAKSTQTDLRHWLNSSIKGATAGSVDATLIEVDTNWDGTVTQADMTNNALFNASGNPDAALGVTSQYVAARTTNINGNAINGIELSPWQGMGGCLSGTVLFVNLGAADPGPGNIGAPCSVSLAGIPAPAGALTSNSIRIIATTNGPGGSNTANAEVLSSVVVTAE